MNSSPAHCETAGRAEDGVSPTDLPPPRVVLLVDDDPDCRLLVRDALCDAAAARAPGGLEVYEASDGAAALRFLRRRAEFAAAPRPDLIYLDMEMPGLDGLDVLREIKQDPALGDIPTVMFTGLADDGPIREAARLGANSYTLKPLDLDDLLRTVVTSADYWFGVHQSPGRHVPQTLCRR